MLNQKYQQWWNGRMKKKGGGGFRVLITWFNIKLMYILFCRYPIISPLLALPLEGTFHKEMSGELASLCTPFHDSSPLWHTFSTTWIFWWRKGDIYTLLWLAFVHCYTWWRILPWLYSRNYVKAVHKNNAVVSVKKMYTFLVFCRKV